MRVPEAGPSAVGTKETITVQDPLGPEIELVFVQVVPVDEIEYPEPEIAIEVRLRLELPVLLKTRGRVFDVLMSWFPKAKVLTERLAIGLAPVAVPES